MAVKLRTPAPGPARKRSFAPVKARVADRLPFGAMAAALMGTPAESGVRLPESPIGVNGSSPKLKFTPE